MLETPPNKTTQSEETRRWLESGQVPTNVVEGPFKGAALEELTKVVHNLHIAQARRDGGGQSCDRRPSLDQRCIWPHAVGQVRRDCADFSKALRVNVVARIFGYGGKPSETNKLGMCSIAHALSE